MKEKENGMKEKENRDFRERSKEVIRTNSAAKNNRTEKVSWLLIPSRIWR